MHALNILKIDSFVEADIYVIKNELKRLDTIEATLRTIVGVLDTLTMRMETMYQEMVMSNSQLNRHDRWIHGLADHRQYSLTS
jgi:hypothetical protein